MAGNRALVIFSLLLLSIPAIAQVNRYIVYYKDKVGSTYNISQPLEFLSQRAIDRRIKEEASISDEDFPVNSTNVSSVKSTGAVVKFSSRWINASLVEATSSQLITIQGLTNVISTRYVAPGKTGIGGRLRSKNKLGSLNSGTTASNPQNNMLGLGDMHADGYTGEGIRIAVLDTGFPGVNTSSIFQDIFQSGQIKDSYNFSYGLPNIYLSNDHGTHVFSIMSVKNSSFEGGIYDADFLLYATEYDPTEYIVEEYNWLFAAERADSAGADIISSSLGYGDFDDASMNHSITDLDGKTAVITQAANKAISKGIIVVNAVGNKPPIDFFWQSITFPADGPNVLAIGSVTENNARSSFSLFGPTNDGRIKPDVAALGSGAAAYSSAGILEFGNGTSFSTPLVASLVAGVKQMLPNLKASEIISLIKKSGTLYFNPTNELGYGVPSYKAIKNILSGNSEFHVTVYPNPFQDYLQVNIGPPSDYEIHISISNTVGERVALFEYNDYPSWNYDGGKLDLKGLAPGIYFARVSVNNSSKTFRIIKEP